MRKLSFKKSSVGSIGVELEFQIIDRHTHSLTSRAKDLILNLKESPYQKRITPEVTQSMIEVNTSIHHCPHAMLQELYSLQDFLLTQATKLNIAICGGGTHPFCQWKKQKIFPTVRYQKLARRYRYLAKQATMFGQHIHIGCGSAEDALYLTHALTRYVPQFIAMSASSPFFESINTGYFSTRSMFLGAFPVCGVIPYLINWSEFSDYFYKMRKWGIVVSMKDFYWDIRPKPEFGTVEIRVCDTPLTLEKAVIVTAYIQALAIYLLRERPVQVCHELYYLHTHNRFQASRYGFDGEFINPYTNETCSISEDTLVTIKKIADYAEELDSMKFISQLQEDVEKKHCDAILLRDLFKESNSLPEVVAHQCKIWSLL